MAYGTVKKLIAEKGFGFIRGEDGTELFFHMSACPTFNELREGQTVSYTRTTSAKGPRAEAVRAEESAF